LTCDDADFVHQHVVDMRGIRATTAATKLIVVIQALNGL
jgi:hypothetical protein